MYMGSTHVDAQRAASVGNHPHVYGEHYQQLLTMNSKLESSPCIWGALTEVGNDCRRLRIIPMYMGSTGGHMNVGEIKKNHPHVYGEHTKKSLYIGIFKLQGCRFLLTSLLKTT